MRWIATGATRIGMLTPVPATLVVRSTSLTSTSTRGISL